MMVMPRSGVTWELMDRCKGDPRVVRDNRFGPIAVMRIKIPNRNAFSRVFQGIKGSDGDVVEVTKPHCVISGRVMSRGPHETECALAIERCQHSFDSRAGRTQSVFVNLWIKRRVCIEVARRPSDLFHMLARMRPQYCRFTGRFRNAPFPIRMPLL